MNVFISPSFNRQDAGDGGIRRVVEAQIRWLPELGVNIAKSVQEADIIAIHATSWIAAPNIPHVTHCHGLYWSEYQWPRWAREANKSVIENIRQSQMVTTPSEWVAQVLRRNLWIDPVIIPHGIEPDEWPIQDNHDGYVLWNKTRVDAICDPEPLNQLASRVRNIKFVSTFGASLPNVKLTGRLGYDQAKEIIQHAGVYLCTARETFGIGTLEAMASGIPILGWNYGGQAEFVEHKVHGWLAEPGDYDSLREGLEFCLSHRKELGANARALVLEKFTWQTVMTHYAELYRSIAERSTHPKISVVIPCYNLAQYLPGAVESVARQGMDSETEIIIVNDASPDDTAKIARQLAKQHKNVKVITNKVNQYLAGALNTGIAAAQGDYIIPLDADNMLGPNTLEVLSGELDRRPELDIVFGKLEIIEESGSSWISTWPSDKFDFTAQMRHRNQCPSTSMYRKSIWARTGGYRRRCKTAEDADFWCRTTSFGAEPLRVTDLVTLRYRNRPDSMSHVNRDWPWEAWYPWASDADLLTPYRHPEHKISLYEPVISVVIPVGPGHENLVVDAIDSIVAQSFQNWEVVVVNDTGRSLSWIHPFVKLITTKGSMGVGYARNLGIATAQGDLFIPLDADDYLEPSALEDLYKAWLRYGGYIYSDWYVAETQEIKTTPDFHNANLLSQLPHAVTALYSKQAWLEVSGFDENPRIWEDWDFVLKIVNKGYCGTRVPKPLLIYRMSAGKRREVLFAAKDEVKQTMFNKWEPYISGRENLMGCGCSKSNIKLAPRSARALLSTPAPGGNMSLLEYTGGGGGTRMFVGQKSGVKYRFGDDPDHRIRFVHDEDVPGLMVLKLFKAHEREPITS